MTAQQKYRIALDHVEAAIDAWPDAEAGMRIEKASQLLKEAADCGGFEYNDEWSNAMTSVGNIHGLLTGDANNRAYMVGVELGKAKRSLERLKGEPDDS